LRLVRSLLLAVLILPLFCQTGLSQTLNNGSGEEGPFRVRPELAPGVPFFAVDNALFDAVGEDIWSFPGRLDMRLPTPAGEEKEGKGRTLMQHLSFTFSRASTREIRIDPSQRGDEEKAWEQFRSLSSSFQMESYADSLEAMGKIIQPQVNLRIEF